MPFIISFFLFLFLFFFKWPTSQQVSMLIHPWSIRRLTARGGGECGHQLLAKRAPNWAGSQLAADEKSAVLELFVWSAGSLLFQVVAALQHTEWTQKNPLTGSWGLAHTVCVSLCYLFCLFDKLKKNKKLMNWFWFGKESVIAIFGFVIANNTLKSSWSRLHLFNP